MPSLVSLLFLLTAAVTPVVPGTDVEKCPRVPMPGLPDDAPLVVVDDEVQPLADGLGRLQDVDRQTMEISCWDPETGRIDHRVEGVPVVAVLTKTGMDVCAEDGRRIEERSVSLYYVCGAMQLRMEAAIQEAWDLAHREGGG